MTHSKKRMGKWTAKRFYQEFQNSWSGESWNCHVTVGRVLSPHIGGREPDRLVKKFCSCADQMSKIPFCFLGKSRHRDCRVGWASSRHPLPEKSANCWSEKEISVNSTRLKILWTRWKSVSSVFSPDRAVADWLVGWNNDRLMTGARYSSVGTRSLVSCYSHSSQVDRMC